MSFENIPLEMREFRQWVIWRAEEIAGGKSTKLPYQPLNPGQLASVTDPSHWSSYDEAVNASSWANGIGFVFTPDCPYTGIDLDETSEVSDIRHQQDIYQQFQTYSELSPSGRGLHLIVKGKVPTGRRLRKIEIYPHGRYFTMTGNVFQVLRPIADRQYQLSTLYDEMSKLINNAPVAHQGDAPQTANDREIWDMACAAQNGARFLALWNGDWQQTTDARTNEPYISQSEADLALMNMIGFYSQNAEQMERMFHTSALGQRPKAFRKDYMGWLINKAFDQLPPPVSIEGATDVLRQQITRDVRSLIKGKQAAPPIAEYTPYTAPPGLMGKIAQWCYNASPRPVPEIALAASIGLMAGIVGRAYNVSATGLNQYIALIGSTGVGKEAMASTIDRLMAATAIKANAITQFRGPAEIASGQALIKFLENQPSCLTIIGEFGYRLQALSSDNANAADVFLKRVLLDVYGKSGGGQTYHPMIYSDSTKNTKQINSPAFTLLCEGTPTSFYANINERMIEDGLLPRFTVIEYLGKRVPDNEYAHTAIPSADLVDELANLVLAVNMRQSTGATGNVQLEPDARAFTKELDRYADAQVNNTDAEVTKGLWTRAYLKTLKLAALVAVGMNYENPVITLPMAQWAKAIIVHEIGAFMQRFNEGEFGTAALASGRNETSQVRDAARTITAYLSEDYTKLKSYRVDADFHRANITPYQYLIQKFSKAGSFRSDRADIATVAKRSLQYLIDVGAIALINTRSPEWRNQWGTKGANAQLYMVTDYDKLKDIAGRRSLH